MKKNIVAIFLAVMLLTTLFASNFSIAFAENEDVETPTTEVDANNPEENIANEEIYDEPVKKINVSEETQKRIDEIKKSSADIPFVGAFLPSIIDYIFKAIANVQAPPTTDEITHEKLDSLIASTGRIEASQQIAENANINEIASQLQTFVSTKMLFITNIMNYQNELAEALQVLETQKAELLNAEKQLAAFKEVTQTANVLEQTVPTQVPATNGDFVIQTSIKTGASTLELTTLTEKAPMETDAPLQTEAPSFTQESEIESALEATPEPSEMPEATPEPLETPEATFEPSATPEPTFEPSATPEPTPGPSAVLESNSLLDVFEKRIEELKKSIVEKEKEIEELKGDIANSNKDIMRAIKEPVAGNTFEMTVSVFGDYISDKAVTLSKNPFVNYYDYLIKNGSFAVDAQKLSNNYEQKLMTIYANCMVFDMFARQTQYVNATSANKRKEISATIENRMAKYSESFSHYNQILSDRENMPQRYYFGINDYIDIASIGSVTYNMGYFTASSSNANQNFINAMQHNVNYSDNTYENIYAYMNKIDKMIEKEFTAEAQATYSLREFLQSKNFAVPSQAKYLAIGGTNTVGFSFTTGDTIKAYRLDRTPENGAVKAEQYVCYTKGWGVNNYNNTEFCYFYDKPSSEKATGGADLIINGNSVHYDNIALAWNAASDAKPKLPSSASVTVKLQQDWIAKPVGTSNLTSFGTGEGFKNHAIGGTATLDLNGYTVSRNLRVPVADGSVFKATGLTIISSSEKPGIITGGNTTGQGGGIYAGKIDGIYIGPGIVVKNCNIKENYAQQEGGGIFIQPDSSNKVYLTNVQITGNKSAAFGGGVYQTLGSEVEIAGKIVVTGNMGKDNRYNYCLANNSVRCATISISKRYPLTTDSRITISHKVAYGWNYITEYTNKDYSYVFGNDLGYYITLNYGSGNSQYVWNDKRGRGL